MKFGKIFVATLLACVVSSVVGFVIWLVIIFSAIGSFSLESEVTLKPKTILKIELDEIFSEAPSSNPFMQIDFNTMEVRPTLTLLNALTAIEAAAIDENIEAIYLSPSSTSMVGTAALEEIRAALQEFKKSGKPIIAYNTIYTQSGYYLASVADKVYVQPEGMILWQGLSTNTMFYKGLLDKLDISVDVFRPTVCRYKSAVEPFILDKMSNENRAQMQQLISSMWSTLSSEVALSRALTLEDVNRIADNLDCMDLETALAEKMVDGLIYEDQLPALFREAGADIAEQDNDVNYIDFSKYVTVSSAKYQKIGADKVAIIYAEGSIVDGEGTDAKVYGDLTAAALRKARYDDSIKAVVLRVNSPGGSALASDVMWREAELLREAKPLIVSMGSYAASGGYYISAPADAIFADKLTLTGSIGVFSMIPNVEKGVKNKLGITFDGVKTNKSSDFLSMPNGMDQVEKKVMQANVDKVYGRFTSLVSEGRNLPIEKVLEIAQGRVWSGTEAVELGLADSIGGLKAAIAYAVTTAGIDDSFRVVEMTDEPTPFATLFSGAQMRIKSMLGIDSPALDQYHEIRTALEPLDTKHGMLMYSPYKIEL